MPCLDLMICGRFGRTGRIIHRMILLLTTTNKSVAVSTLQDEGIARYTFIIFVALAHEKNKGTGQNFLGKVWIKNLANLPKISWDPGKAAHKISGDLPIKKQDMNREPFEKTCCMHAMKIKASTGAFGLQRELQDRKGKHCTNVDKKRTPLNMFLTLNRESDTIEYGFDYPEKSLEERIYGRIAEAGASVREANQDRSRPFNKQDSVICESFILQMSHHQAMKYLEKDGMLDEHGEIRSDKKLPEDSETLRYFIKSFNFMLNRFGDENVISGYLHMDEYTPHMHVQVVPLKTTKLNVRGQIQKNSDGTDKEITRLSAKQVFSPDVLKNLWVEYATAMQDYGFDVDVAEAPEERRGQYQPIATINAVIDRKDRKIAQMQEKIKKLKSAFKHEESIRKQELKNLNDEIAAAKISLQTLNEGLKKGRTALKYPLTDQHFYKASQVRQICNGYEAELTKYQAAIEGNPDQREDFAKMLKEFKAVLSRLQELESLNTSPDLLQKRLKELDDIQGATHAKHNLVNEILGNQLQRVVSYDEQDLQNKSGLHHIEFFSCLTVKEQQIMVVLYDEKLFSVQNGWFDTSTSYRNMCGGKPNVIMQTKIANLKKVLPAIRDGLLAVKPSLPTGKIQNVAVGTNERHGGGGGHHEEEKPKNQVSLGRGAAINTPGSSSDKGESLYDEALRKGEEDRKRRQINM